ncbi:MAG: outer membrane lipoprotein-sorting protein [Desulfobacteraceae bacterium]|nr:outer membrane lipoprotein-sorting protein [Desulfobacteraceae bacterium]
MTSFIPYFRFEHNIKGDFRTCLVILLTILFFSLFLNITGFAEELTGRQVMEKQKELHEVDTEYGEETMLLVDIKSGAKEKRQVKRYAKKIEKELHRYLVAFTAPADIKGTALLTHEHDKEDDQWIYMPATKKMQRIAKASKKTYFMGTDFTYEDMEPEEIKDFNYKILNREAVTHVKPNKDCYVIEAIPGNKEKQRSSGYSKRILWVDSENFITLKIEFYDRRSRLIKTQKSFEIQQVVGTIYRPKKTIMENHKKKHKTLTLVNNRELNKTIEDKVFSERFLLSGKHCE